MLDYRLLVFRTVAEKLNFTYAAEAPHISQPTVTQHIKQLEAHYGTPLFRRTSAGIALTDAGHVLLKKSGLTPCKLHIVLENSGGETIKGLLASRRGLGFLSRHTAQSKLALGQFTSYSRLLVDGDQR